MPHKSSLEDVFLKKTWKILSEVFMTESLISKEPLLIY